MVTMNFDEIVCVTGGDCECCCGYPDMQRDIGCFGSSTKCAAGCWVESDTYYHNCNVPCQSGYNCNGADKNNSTKRR